MKKLIFITLIIFKSTFTYSAPDTLTNWQIYLNQKLIFSGSEIQWGETLSQKEYEALNAAVEVHNVDLYKDSLGFNFFCDYAMDLNGYFFIKDTSDKLVCIVQRNLNLKPSKYGGHVVENSRGIAYMPLWRLLLNYPTKNNPKTLKIYYLNPLDDSNFKDGKERLIAVLKIFSS